MQKLVRIFLFLFFLCGTTQVFAQENEIICSQRYDFCFQIPPNFFMLHTNDIESPMVMYKTVDGSSSIEINNGFLTESIDMHKMYLMILGQYSGKKYRITLKKEYDDFFILSGYTEKGRGFYQKVIKIEQDYASAYLEFPKGNKKYSNISQLLFDHFEKTIIN